MDNCREIINEEGKTVKVYILEQLIKKQEKDTLTNIHKLSSSIGNVKDSSNNIKLMFTNNSQNINNYSSCMSK